MTSRESSAISATSAKIEIYNIFIANSTGKNIHK